MNQGREKKANNNRVTRSFHHKEREILREVAESGLPWSIIWQEIADQSMTKTDRVTRTESVSE